MMSGISARKQVEQGAAKGRHHGHRGTQADVSIVLQPPLCGSGLCASTPTTLSVFP